MSIPFVKATMTAAIRSNHHPDEWQVNLMKYSVLKLLPQFSCFQNPVEMPLCGLSAGSEGCDHVALAHGFLTPNPCQSSKLLKTLHSVLLSLIDILHSIAMDYFMFTIGVKYASANHGF